MGEASTTQGPDLPPTAGADAAGAPQRPRSVELRDARALRALAHPTRIKLVGLLRLQGPLTATQAARELGETPQRCTFHLGQLARYGLVEEAGGGRGRERPWRATASSTSWPNVVAGPEASAAAQLLEAVVAEQHFEAVMAWIERKDAEPEEWQEAAQLNDAALYLTADELAELGRRVWALLEPFTARNERAALRPAGARPVAFLNLAFPRQTQSAKGAGRGLTAWPPVPMPFVELLERVTPALLRAHPGFRRFWMGQTVSLIGDQVSLVALPLVALLALDASAAQMGYLTAAALVPNLLFALHAGALVDRHGHRRQMMIAADLGRGLLLALVPVGAALGVLSLPGLYVIAFLTGSLGVLFMVSYNALFVALVPRDDYLGAMSLLNGSRALSGVVGPSLGGILVQALTAPVAVAADAVSYLASALFLRRVAAVEPPCEQARRGLLLGGARFIAASSIVRGALAATATLNFFDYGFLTLFLLYATRSLGITPGVLGVVLGAGAVGGVIGSLVTGRVARRIGVGPTFAAGCVVFPLPLLLVPLAGGPQPLVLLALLAAEFGAGLGVMMLDISIGAIFAAVIPDRFRSRVSGAYMLVNYGVRPLGALAAGALATAVGTRETLWIAAAGGSLAALWLVRSPLLRLRTLTEEEGGLAGPAGPDGGGRSEDSGGGAAAPGKAAA